MAARFKLSDLYDADLRAADGTVRAVSANTFIPHPLNNVRYSDGTSVCRHAKRHVGPFAFCNQRVRISGSTVLPQGGATS